MKTKDPEIKVQAWSLILKALQAEGLQWGVSPRCSRLKTLNNILVAGAPRRNLESTKD